MKKLMLASLLAMLCGATAQAARQQSTSRYVQQSIQGTFRFETGNPAIVSSARAVIVDSTTGNSTRLTLAPSASKTNPLTFSSGSQITFEALRPNGTVLGEFQGTRFPTTSRNWTFKYNASQNTTVVSSTAM